MQIFVEHWGGLFAVLPQFCLIFNIGGKWTSTKNFFLVSNLSEDQNKTKSSSPEMEHFFSPISSTYLRSDAHQSQIILEGMQMNTILKLLGGIIPPIQYLNCKILHDGTLLQPWPT